MTTKELRKQATTLRTPSAKNVGISSDSHDLRLGPESLSPYSSDYYNAVIKSKTEVIPTKELSGNKPPPSGSRPQRTAGYQI